MPRGIYPHKKASAETRMKMSLSHRGVPRPKEVCEKIAKAKLGNRYGEGNRGKKHTDETRQKYREAHLGEKSTLWKGGVSAHPQYRAYHSKIRRARKKGAKGTFTLEEWESLKERHNRRCLCCGRAEPEVKLTADHIVPLVRGGTNDISNIQPLCGSCNSRKNIKIVAYA